VPRLFAQRNRRSCERESLLKISRPGQRIAAASSSLRNVNSRSSRAHQFEYLLVPVTSSHFRIAGLGLHQKDKHTGCARGSISGAVNAAAHRRRRLSGKLLV